MKGDAELYRVFLPFRAPGNQIATPVEMPDVAISADGAEYRATIVVTATSGEDALKRARLILADLFGTFAVQGVGFVEIHDARRLVQLVDPKPVLEGPPPPFDVVGGGVTPYGAEVMDPAGEMRRARRIVNMHGNLTQSRGNVDKERSWLAVREAWPADLRRVVALLHAGEVAGDPDVAFILAFSALEALAPPAVALLPTKMPDRSDRDRVVRGVRDVLTHQPNLSGTDVDRLISSLSATQAESPIARFVFAFAEVGIEIDAAELRWIRNQRGTYIHSFGFENSKGAIDRRNAFRAAVADITGKRLDALAQRAATQ